LLGGLLAGAAVARPNIVILFADDLGYGELGCQGNPQIPTPHIDQLARGGIRFVHGYVAASYCSASRAGLMTGRYPARFGYDYNPTGARNLEPGVGLPPSEATLADGLRDCGYATALIGKWHLGGTARYHPLRRGFDEFFGFLHEGHFFVPSSDVGVTTMLRRKSLPDGSTRQPTAGRWTSPDGRLVLSNHMGHNEPAYDADNPIIRNGQPVVEPSYLTEAFTREAVEFIDRNSTRPFFLYVAYNAVHSPLQAPNRIVDRFRHSIPDVHRRIFAGMLASMDDSVGAILQQLRRSQVVDNTVVFFISDNGGPTRELTSSNLPLRGGKGQLYEGGIRVPFIMQWPDQLPEGRTENRPVIALDVAATALAAAKANANPMIDGVDLLPYLNGERRGRPHQQLFWRMNYKKALRDGDWKIVRTSAGPSASWELYDLSDDPSEAHDLATSRPQVLSRLTAQWEQLNSQMQPPMRLP
jgi:arylsulfatase B